MTVLRNLPLLLGRDDRELAVVLAVVVILLKHGTDAAYVRGCVCGDCKEHQQRRMGRNG